MSEQRKTTEILDKGIALATPVALSNMLRDDDASKKNGEPAMMSLLVELARCLVTIEHYLISAPTEEEATWLETRILDATSKGREGFQRKLTGGDRNETVS